ncbi:MAG: hypothetical protein ACQERB_05215 [Promethearchaeati archaeon]
MIEEGELIVFILGIVVFIFITINYKNLKTIPEFKFFFISIILILIAWCATVFEAIILYDLLNYIEHICYVLSSMFIFIWIILIMKRRRAENHN